MPASPQSSSVRASPLPLTLPGWKSPWTSVSRIPHASIAANLRGRSPRNCSSTSRSSTDRSCLVRQTRRLSPNRVANRARVPASPAVPKRSAPWSVRSTIVEPRREASPSRPADARRLRASPPHGSPQATRGVRRGQGPSVPALLPGPPASPPFMGEEVGHKLQPDGLTPCRDAPKAGQVPRANLRGRLCDRDAKSPQYGLRPGEIGLGAAWTRIWLPQGMIAKAAVPWLGCHRSIDLSKVDHATAMRSISAQPRGGAERQRRCQRSRTANDGLNVLPPRRGDGHRRQAASAKLRRRHG